MRSSHEVKSKEAVVYVRVSSKEQEKEGFSIPAQFKLLREYALDKGFTIVKEFGDVETAKASGREGFGEMVAFLKKYPNCRTLLVEKTDRLYRNFKDYVTLDEFKPDIHFVKEGQILSENSKSSEKLNHGFKLLMAKNYIDNLAEETKKGMTEKAEQGIWPSVAPIGYKNILGEGGKRTIEPDSFFGPMIARLFQEYSTGNYSLKEITSKFKEEGLVFRKSKQPLPKSTVHKILNNPMYSGEFAWKGTRYKGTYTPLISRELWLKVQAILGRRSGKKNHKSRNEFTYTGFLKCGHCGCALVGEIKKGKYVYYHCTGYKGKCNEPYTREEVLTNQLSETFKKLTLDGEILEWMKTTLKQSHLEEKEFHTQNLERLTSEYSKIKARLETLYEDKLDGRIDGEFYDRKSKELRLDQERLLTAIQGHRKANNSYQDQGIELLEMAQSAHAEFMAESSTKKRDLLKFYLQSASWKGGVLESHLKQPFEMLAVSNSENETKKPLEVGSKGFNEKWLPAVDSKCIISLNSPRSTSKPLPALPLAIPIPCNPA